MPDLTQNDTSSDDLLYALDPLTLLMDARQQLLAVVDQLAGTEDERVALALGAVVAQDLALADVARGVEAVVVPSSRAARATVEEGYSARNALFEVLAEMRVSFDTEVLVPWTGTETWHVHLVGLAMFEGAQAHALRQGEPVPASLRS